MLPSHSLREDYAEVKGMEVDPVNSLVFFCRISLVGFKMAPLTTCKAH